MTEIVRDGIVKRPNKETMICTWSGLDSDDSGKAIDFSGYPDKTVHIIGTFSSDTITLYGSNDPAVITDRDAGTLFDNATADWVISQDSLGNNIAKTSNGGDVILDDYQYYSPNANGGSGSGFKIIIKATRSPR